MNIGFVRFRLRILSRSGQQHSLRMGNPRCYAYDIEYCYTLLEHPSRRN